ncbi:mechanosensitive ion channel MscS [Candidatus Nitrosoglobus terrae]|uniref:Mechanosensitive ion channel MscS n=1 Tax=Candidatus Nitrosoglobus terrae TaxID=1630141 RepID=A0A1Q2SKM9_9GAMM|nr:mechanosensitive ion channel family protein [Candidatus Nitrosoglobus terrae]BAW79674.1 mechanosensitive ion channel MscS [Candidatus Nitrosoglobus terrae]
MKKSYILLLLTTTLMAGNGQAKESADLQETTAKESTTPEITEIKPHPIIGARERQWIAILGSNFAPDSSVILYLKSRTFPIPTERTQFISNKELSIYANVSVRSSTWTAQVINHREQASKKFSFKVISPDLEANIQQNQEKPQEQDRKTEVVILDKKVAEVNEHITQATAEGSKRETEKKEQQEKLKEQERKTEAAILDKKAEETNEKITQAQKIAEESKLEAEKAANEKTTAQKEIEKKEQEAKAAKIQVEVAKAVAQTTGDKSAEEKAQKLANKAKQLEESVATERKNLEAAEKREQEAQKRSVTNKAEIEALRKELSELKKRRAEKRTLIEKLTDITWIILAGFIVWFLKRMAVKKFERTTAEKDEVEEGSSRLRTLVLLLNWLGTILIVMTAFYLMLAEFGINMAPVFASLGIAGLALSFGGQYLIRDIINGVFILIEGQYNINDVIQIGDFSGFVESINLRRTQLRDVQGRAIYIPNGEIKTVINFTKGYGRAMVDIGVPFKENIDQVMEVMEEIMKEMRQVPKYERFIKSFEILGVESLKKSEIIIRCRFKTASHKQWIVAREYRRRVKNRFEELNIEMS